LRAFFQELLGRAWFLYEIAYVAMLLLVLSVIAAAGGNLGLVALIAKGYGFMTWVFILVFVIPVLTIGLARILRRDSATGIKN
jgi:uncharacterized membrane protein YkvI